MIAQTIVRLLLGYLINNLSSVKLEEFERTIR